MEKPTGPLSVYDFKYYRKFLLAWINHQDQTRGLYRKLAEAARCETSHISRVLGNQLELTMDQGYRICKFVGLDGDEKKYFLKLIEWERSGDSDFKKEIERELQKMVSLQENLSQRFQDQPVMMNGQELVYYSSWHWSAIHILVSIPGYRKIEQIAKKLSLSEEFVRKSLHSLKEFGLVEEESGQWRMTNKHIHLGKDSPMNSVQHGNWRQQAVLRSQNPNHQDLHYTIVQSLSLNDYEKIKKLFLKTLDEYRSIANPSAEEELVCLTLDFFKIE